MPRRTPRELFERLGVAHRLHGRASQLSGGELARAAFAVALARDAPVVIVDEPTAELDRESAETLLDAMRAATRAARPSSSPRTIRMFSRSPTTSSSSSGAETPARRRWSPAPPPHGDGRIALQREHLIVNYGSTRALADVSIELREGELGVVVGRSGSGKSTLLMLLGGWLGGDGPAPSWSELAYVPQRFGLVPELTVARERRAAGAPRRIGRRHRALLERLALGELASRYPSEISIGQQQRVAVARALNVRPAVLLVDEPTSHQDARRRNSSGRPSPGRPSKGRRVSSRRTSRTRARRAHRSWTIENGRLVAIPRRA